MLVQKPFEKVAWLLQSIELAAEDPQWEISSNSSNESSQGDRSEHVNGYGISSSV